MLLTDVLETANAIYIYVYIFALNQDEQHAIRSIEKFAYIV